jgi:hypothetical protein
MRRSSTGLLSGITRLTAIATLVGVLVVLPLLVWRGIGSAGGVGGIDWQTIVRSGRIDADTVVALGLVVFTALWAWFALTAVVEIARVVAWRRPRWHPCHRRQVARSDGWCAPHSCRPRPSSVPGW